MSVGEILDRTFRLYRKNFARFIAIVAVVYIPIALITAAVVGPGLTTTGTFYYEGHGSEAGYGARAEGIGGQGAALIVIVVLLGLLAQLLCMAALIKGISECYLGNDVSVGQAYRAAFPKILSLIWAAILIWLVMVGAMIPLNLLVFPLGPFALIPIFLVLALLLLHFVCVPQAIVVERCSGLAGLKRSWRLVSGNLGKVFVLCFLLGLIIVATMLLLMWAIGALGRSLATQDPQTYFLVFRVATTALQILLAPISAGALSLLYFDLRIRKEGFDLEMLARSLGSGGTPPYGVPPVQQV